jgi:hypothetical protein
VKRLGNLKWQILRCAESRCVSANRAPARASVTGCVRRRPARTQSGDLRLAYGPAYNQGGTQIGRVDIFSVLTEAAPDPTMGYRLKQLFLTVGLRNGTITTQTLESVSQTTLTILPTVGAVTGGTGAYEGAAGQFYISELGIPLPANVTIRVVEEQPGEVVLVLPATLPASGSQLSDSEPEAVAGGGTLDSWGGDLC